ncbi:MAG: hypothetical protein ACTSQE_00900 [Candidatus Heimdallarchaeaceae archaeon]
MTKEGDSEGKSMILKDKVEKTLALMEGKEVSPVIPDDFTHLSCYVEGCKNVPHYTIGSLLPSTWFTSDREVRLVPVIVVSCIEHRNTLVDNLPAKTVSVIVRDVSKKSHELLSDMLKQAIIRKEEDFTVYYGS